MEKIKGIFIVPSEDGSYDKIETVELENTLEAKQGYVNGLIDIVEIEPGIDMIVNDEGLLLDLPYNESATKIFNYSIPNGGGYIVGNVLIVGNTETEEGIEHTSLTDEQIKHITKFLN